VAEELAALLREKAAVLGAAVHALEVQPDHVHLFVESDPTVPVQFLVNQFKGYTSRVLRQRHASLRSRLPSLWSRSYYAQSEGTLSLDAMHRFVAAQKGI
jgi:putative transposase